MSSNDKHIKLHKSSNYYTFKYVIILDLHIGCVVLISIKKMFNENKVMDSNQ